MSFPSVSSSGYSEISIGNRSCSKFSLVNIALSEAPPHLGCGGAGEETTVQNRTADEPWKAG